MILQHALLSTLAGPLLAVAGDRGLQQLRILGEVHDYRPALARLWPAPLELVENPDHFASLAIQLGEYFVGRRRSFDVALDPCGTLFQVAVWHRICEIPYGKLKTFRQLAADLDRPRAARAVGQAVAQNPLSILVPSHRVIGVAGDLVGFLSGNDLKARLLRLEGHTLDRRQRVAPPRLF